MNTVNEGAPGTVGTAAEFGLPIEVDVVVVGSGAGGMMSALAAALEGAEVLLVESEHLVGGTTAISGGATWVPNHGIATKHLKAHDSASMAREYILGEGRDQVLDPEVVDAFIENAPKMARFVEEHTYLSWIPGIWPDYHSDIPGATHCRSLFPGPFPPEVLGEHAAIVRPPKKSGQSKSPLPLWPLGRMKGTWIAGYAMIGAFLEASLRVGVTIRTETRAVGIATDPHGVTGIFVEVEGAQRLVTARKGVVLASGGFEGSEELTSKYLGAPFTAQVTPAGHQGEGVRMAQSAGAKMSSMSETWWMPAMQIPGETLDGRPISRLVQGERALPHTIMVNSRGERFANEAAPYNHLGRIMREVDPVTGAMPNASVWMIFDDFYRTHYGFFGEQPGCELPAFVRRSDTLEGLAEQCGIDPGGLTGTIEEFNPAAALGRDPWFNRGATIYERFFGDHHPRLGRYSPDAVAPRGTAKARRVVATALGPFVGPVLARTARARRPDRLRSVVVPALATIMRPCLDNPRTGTLGPIDTGPFYAVPVEASSIGTIGGPRTDGRGRVLDESGAVIPGLYAAGNAAGAPTHGFYGGAGGTITLGLTFGLLAGRDAASR
ncbi:FAD-dependent oxidoreductase [Nocardioides marmoriginsengisoli]|uniref:FAD-dependent oxidoreductase n=1 Tax=Nocardioides marmoriginsengisoli TaxID=661483 RepID=UPI001C836477|nr:FAD-dependent oxidoreductase [Nocardioides marmoriginsengisoli]